MAKKFLLRRNHLLQNQRRKVHPRLRWKKRMNPLYLQRAASQGACRIISPSSRPGMVCTPFWWRLVCNWTPHAVSQDCCDRVFQAWLQVPEDVAAEGYRHYLALSEWWKHRTPFTQWYTKNFSSAYLPLCQQFEVGDYHARASRETRSAGDANTMPSASCCPALVLRFCVGVRTRELPIWTVLFQWMQVLCWVQCSYSAHSFRPPL